MFLDKYLNNTYLNILYDNYEEFFIESLDEKNFKKVYNILKNNNFNYINDIIINYLELFTIEPKYVFNALIDIKNILGKDYVNMIGNDMTILDRIIELSNKYEEKDITKE